jgi:hypothetical protein
MEERKWMKWAVSKWHGWVIRIPAKIANPFQPMVWVSMRTFPYSESRWISINA